MLARVRRGAFRGLAVRQQREARLCANVFYLYPNALGQGNHLYRDIEAPIPLTPGRTVPFAEGTELREYKPAVRGMTNLHKPDSREDTRQAPCRCCRGTISAASDCPKRIRRSPG